MMAARAGDASDNPWPSDDRSATARRANIHLRAVAMLLEAGAKVDVTDERGMTALMWAAGLDPYVEVTAALLKAGTKVNIRSSHGWTPLMFAAQNNPNPQVISALIKAGADVNAKNDKGRTALDIAHKYKNATAAAALIQAGAKEKQG
jgi:ankyrin repeat protein